MTENANCVLFYLTKDLLIDINNSTTHKKKGQMLKKEKKQSIFTKNIKKIQNFLHLRDELKIYANATILTLLLSYIPIALVEIFIFENNLWISLSLPLIALCLANLSLYWALVHESGFACASGISFIAIILAYQTIFWPAQLYMLIIVGTFINLYILDWRVFYRHF